MDHLLLLFSDGKMHVSSTQLLMQCTGDLFWFLILMEVKHLYILLATNRLKNLKKQVWSLSRHYQLSACGNVKCWHTRVLLVSEVPIGYLIFVAGTSSWWRWTYLLCYKIILSVIGLDALFTFSDMSYFRQ